MMKVFTRPTSASDFNFPQMKYGKCWFHLQFFFIANFHFLGLFTTKKQVKSEFFFRLSRGVAGVAVRVLVEICVDDISDISEI
jgi:hypothetical protein